MCGNAFGVLTSGQVERNLIDQKTVELYWISKDIYSITKFSKLVGQMRWFLVGGQVSKAKENVDVLLESDYYSLSYSAFSGLCYKRKSSPRGQLVTFKNNFTLIFSFKAYSRFSKKISWFCLLFVIKKSAIPQANNFFN